MDKFFIQNAFKTLDEIEEEMTSKQFLRETKEKPAGDEVASYNKALKIAKENNKPVIYGYSNNRLAGKFFSLDIPIICDNVSVCEKNFRNKYKNCSTVYIVYPDKEFVETESLKEDINLDMDELSDKYVGLTCNINTEDSNYDKEIGTIKSLVDYEGDFKNSIWEIALNTGVITNVKGQDLEISLNEKLPKDLARAYINSVSIFRDSKDKNTGHALHHSGEYFPTKMSRRAVRTDFENSNYKEISKEEALKYSKAPLRSKLRVLFSNNYYSYVMMWDENNVPIVRPQELERFMGPGESPFTFKNIIKNANKIYVTDEADHKINHKLDQLTPYEQELRSKADEISSKAGRWNSTEQDKSYGRMAKDLSKYLTDKELGHLDVDDTGDHSKTIKNKSYTGSAYAVRHTYRNLIREQRNYLAHLDRYKNNPDSEDVKNALNRSLQYLDDYQNTYLSRLDNYKKLKEPNRLAPHVNLALAELVVLKYILRDKQKEFMNTENNQSDDYMLKYHTYVRLNQQLQKLEAELLQIQKDISEVKSQMTPELKQSYEELQQQKLGNLAEQFQDLFDRLTQFRKDHKLKTDESLKEDLGDNSEVHLRIYTQDLDGYEDFIDGPTPTTEWSNEDEALEKAKELVKDGDYEHVCLVRITYYPEENDEDVDILFDSYDLDESLKEAITDKRSIGEIVDSMIKQEESLKTEESLTESKSFNVKDENEVIDAVTYKTVGDETEENLVVVDPSLESQDDDLEPHAGDALLQCPECKTVIFQRTSDLVQDGDSNVYNKDMPCPHCGAHSGFSYLYQVADKDNLKNENEEIENNDNLNSIESETEGEVEDANDSEDSLPAVESDFIALDDIDNIKEESFEKLVNPYLTKLYENVECFKTTDVKQVDRKTLKVEGNLVGKNGKEKLVEFLFTIKENNATSIVFEGYNNLLTENLKAYNLKGNIKNKELIFESFSYKYNKKVDGKDTLIEGIEK